MPPSAPSRSSRHPGFAISVAARGELQATQRFLRDFLRADTHSGEQEAKRLREVLHRGLASVETVLDLHVSARPKLRGQAPSRRVRMTPSLVGELAKWRYTLSHALTRDTRDNEPDKDWLESRAYAHSGRTVELIGAVLKGFRQAQAGASPQTIALAHR